MLLGMGDEGSVLIAIFYAEACQALLFLIAIDHLTATFPGDIGMPGFLSTQVAPNRKPKQATGYGHGRLAVPTAKLVPDHPPDDTTGQGTRRGIMTAVVFYSLIPALLYRVGDAYRFIEWGSREHRGAIHKPVIARAGHGTGDTAYQQDGKD
jgi:hypothetical protein